MAEPVSPLAHRTSPASSAGEMPDGRLFWRWVARSVRPYAGWLFVGLGVLAIGLGYLGVSREALVAKQLPYLISGGIFGLALMAVGTFYLVTEDLRRDSGRLDHLERLVLELHTVLLARPDAPEAAASAHAVGGLEGRNRTNGVVGDGQHNRLVALTDSRRFHRADCHMVEGKVKVVEMTASTIRRRHLEPCGMCDPVVPAGA